MPKFVLVWDNRLDDYYVGTDAAIYKDGRRVWFGYSSDQVQEILEAVLGGEAFEVHTITSTAGWEFPEALADVPGVR